MPTIPPQDLSVLIPHPDQSQRVPVQSTEFAYDVMSRFVCNTWSEVLESNGQIPGATLYPRAFNVIVIGGGTFGAAIAQHLFQQDQTHSLRIVVLEAGPFVLPEHQQNLPMMGSALPAMRRPWQASNSPKDHPVPLDRNYPGLLFAIGGRSLAWGGWSPELLDAELPPSRWPLGVVADLKSRHFGEASHQIGVTETNDFVFGELQRLLRQRLFQGTLKPVANKPAPISDAMPLTPLPSHPGVRYAKQPPLDAELARMLDLAGGGPFPNRQTLLDLLKLEAPLAVECRTESGLFPFNKFSVVPILMKASRVAAQEADGTGPTTDARKRLMIVPNCHVEELVTETQADNWVRVRGVRVFRDHFPEVIDLAPGGVVVLALGTIESTRIAQLTFQESLSWRAYQRMGKRLMAHLRSNLNIRIPRAAIPGLGLNTNALQAGALFLKGSAKVDSVERFFHLQITASGLGSQGADSEADLYKKVPDLDGLNALLNATETHIVITLRGIGEMEPPNVDSPNSFVRLKPDSQDFERPQAEVQITPTVNDMALWEVMDQCAEEAAAWLANGQPFEILDMQGQAIRRIIPMKANSTAIDIEKALARKDRRDGLGSTHHEAGTLWMGDNVAASVTNEFGRIHDTTNCYVVGPALFPTIGSPNPMLTGVALARRTGDMLREKVLPKASVFSPAAPAKALFDGTEASYKRWQRVGGNNFYLEDGNLISYGAGDFGLLFFPTPFDEFTLKLQFKIFEAGSHNSGVFICSRHPLYEVPQFVLDRANSDGTAELLANNRAWVSVHSGFEVQIDDNAPLRKNRTGAVYNIPAGDPGEPSWQNYQPGPALRPNNWFEYEINVAKAGINKTDITVFLTDIGTGARVQTTTYQNTDPLRGLLAGPSNKESGYIGLQAYPNSRVGFRFIEIT